MADPAIRRLPELPDEMLFTITKAAVPGALGPRLGRLSMPGRTALETPHYMAISSRGVVPHVSQDMMAKHTNINGVYTGLEDSRHWSSSVIEKGPREVPPIYKFSASDLEAPLRNFIALPTKTMVVLAPRRITPVSCPTSNSNAAISILTSVGFRQLSSEDYADAVKKLRPDIAIAMADVVYGQKPGVKRIAKMDGRTRQWLSDIINSTQNQRSGGTSALFAPILPIGQHQQKEYLRTLAEDTRGVISGLALYDPLNSVDVPQQLGSLPRLSLAPPKSPHHVLDQVALGLDMLTIPFIGEATDAGIALDFVFPTSPLGEGEPLRSMGLDMWPSVHATDLSALRPGCTCYACTRHHRAYIQHLLAAKEMLGWVLLQVHNHRVMDEFFAGIRSSIANGTFEDDVRLFGRVYEPELPAKTGQGPRVRGYQFKSEGPGEPKKNPAAFTTLDDAKERLAEAAAPSPTVESVELEARDLQLSSQIPLRLPSGSSPMPERSV